MDNTNLIYNLANEHQNTGNIRETFFLNQLRVNHRVVSSTFVDFKIDEIEFEIGGKNKNAKQLQALENGFLVKDDIEIGYLNTIPMWHFGLMY